MVVELPTLDRIIAGRLRRPAMMRFSFPDFSQAEILLNSLDEVTIFCLLEVTPDGFSGEGWMNLNEKR